MTSDQEILMSQLADYVAGLPEGTSITTVQAAAAVLPDFDFKANEYCGMRLFDIHFVLVEKLRERGIDPDMSAHDGRDEGLLYNLDFVIRHIGKG